MAANNDELSEFLRAHRAALDPAEFGIVGASPRRVPGLRREELAALAGVSSDYYTRLEQGRPITPSESVLDALSTALRLDTAERSYLYAMARPAPSVRRRGARGTQSVRPGILALLERLGDTPAFVLGRRTDVLATNRMGRALLADFDAMPARERNAVRWIVLDEAARSLFGDTWAGVAADLIGILRLDAARYPDDPRTTALVGELSIKSEDFRQWWAQQKVVQLTHQEKILHHPTVGPMTLHSEALTFPGDADHTLVTYLPKPGSPSEESLALLATWVNQPGH